MAPFATADDYEARYGAADDKARLGVLLADASAFVAGQPGFALRPGDEAQAAALTAVVCAVVNRKMVAGAWSGLSSLSQGAGGLSASLSVHNPSGDFYLTKQEKLLLGVGCGRVGMSDPFGGGGAE